MMFIYRILSLLITISSSSLLLLRYLLILFYYSYIYITVVSLITPTHHSKVTFCQLIIDYKRVFPPSVISPLLHLQKKPLRNMMVLFNNSVIECTIQSISSKFINESTKYQRLPYTQTDYIYI